VSEKLPKGERISNLFVSLHKRVGSEASNHDLTFREVMDLNEKTSYLSLRQRNWIPLRIRRDTLR